MRTSVRRIEVRATLPSEGVKIGLCSPFARRWSRILPCWILSSAGVRAAALTLDEEMARRWKAETTAVPLVAGRGGANERPPNRGAGDASVGGRDDKAVLEAETRERKSAVRARFASGSE